MAILSSILLAAIAAAQFAVAQTDQLKIQSFQWSGNGCPSSGNSVQYETGPGTITIKITDFKTEIGPGISAIEKTKNCAAHIALNPAVSGSKLAVTEVSARGMWYASPDTTLTTYATVFWSKDGSNTYTAQQPHTTNSPTKTLQPFSFSNAIPNSAASQCISGGNNGIMNVNWRAAFTSSSSEGYGAVIAMAGNPLYITIKFAYLPCK